MKKTFKKHSKSPMKPKTTKNVPATAEMIVEFRAEMNSKYMSLEHKFGAFGKNVDSFKESVMAEFHRIGLLVEEQNARNKIVMDQYGLIYDKQVDLEERVVKIEEKIA